MAQHSIARPGTGQIVEIAEDCRRVTLSDNMLAFAGDEGTLNRIPVDEIAGLVARRPGPSWSATALAALTERGAGIVLVGPNHDSRIMSWPIPSPRWTARIRAQLALYPPLARSLLGQLEAARRVQRALALETMGRKKSLEAVKATLPPLRAGRNSAKQRAAEQQEAEIERRYWPWLVGPGFRRSPRKAGQNAIINYGHTRLRIAATRAVHEARLHPGAGLRGGSNSGGLADELMRPFRPLVDLAAAIFIATGSDKVDGRIEAAFARLLVTPLRGRDGLVQIQHGLTELAESMARCFESGEAKLTFRLPARQDPDAIFAMTATDRMPGLEDPGPHANVTGSPAG